MRKVGALRAKYGSPLEKECGLSICYLQLTSLVVTPTGLLLTRGWKTHFRHQMPNWTDFGSESEGRVCRNPVLCNNLREWAIQDLNL